jgi:uncharacterized membrane protein YkoI
MNRKLSIAAVCAVALAAGGVGIAQAVGGSDDDASERATGPGADKAKAAALAITKGGTANSVERDSEDGATWEVEVTKTDGKTVDVRLDENLKLVVVEGDSESGGSDE